MDLRATKFIIESMTRTHLHRAWLVSATLLLVASSAYAESPNAHAAAHGKGGSAAGAKADDKKADDKKADKKTDDKKADDKKPGDGAKGADGKATAADAKDRADAKGKSASDRAERKAKEHDAQKAKLVAKLKSPPDDALRQELRRHAERTARLERIKAVGAEAKDNDAVERATKLLAKEDARHEKWVDRHVAGIAAVTAAAVPPDSKAGAK